MNIIPAEITDEEGVAVALSTGINVMGNVWIVDIFKPKCAMCSKRGRFLERCSSVGLGDEGLNAAWWQRTQNAKYSLSALTSGRWLGTAARERGRRGESVDHLGYSMVMRTTERTWR